MVRLYKDPVQDKEKYRRQLVSLRDSFRRANHPTASKSVIRWAADSVVMSVPADKVSFTPEGWTTYTGELYEDAHEIARQVRGYCQMISVCSDLYPLAWQRVVEVLKADQGEIITPENKETFMRDLKEVAPY